MSAGLCEMSRRYSVGMPTSFDESLEGFARNYVALFEFGAILAGIAVLWFGISAVMLGPVFHITTPDMRETLYRGFILVLTVIGYAPLLAGLLVAAALLGHATWHVYKDTVH
jgi:uncharacterized membrane protein